MRQIEFDVPTYNAKLYPKQVEAGQMAEFGKPNVPVIVREAAGVQIILGSPECDDLTTPDVQVERHPNGWMIFLHPLAGSCPSGYVYFLDDGRSILVKERGYGPTPAIQIVEADARVPEFDGIELIQIQKT